MIGINATVEGVNQGSFLSDFGPFSEIVSAGPPEFIVDLESGDPTRDYFLNINIEDSSILISLTRNVGVSGLTADYDLLFSGLEWFDVPGSTIADVVIAQNTTGAPVSVSNLGANGFTLTIGDMQISAGIEELISLNIVPNHNVPLPASILLLSFGLAGLAVGRRSPLSSRRPHRLGD